MNLRKPLTWLLLLGLFSVWSCTKFDKLEGLRFEEYDPDLAFPLIETTYTISEFIDSLGEVEGLVIEPDGLIRFFYLSDTTIVESEEIYKELPPVIPFELKDTITIAPVSLPSGVRITRAHLNRAAVSFILESGLDEDVTVTFRFENLMKNGQPYEKTMGPFKEDELFLDGFFNYDLVPENDSVRLTYEAVTASGDRIKLKSAIVALFNLEFGYLEGYLGRQEFDIKEDTIEIADFSSLKGGNYLFQDPRINIVVDNSFGFPTRSTNAELKVINVDDKELLLESPAIDNGVDVNYPSLDEVGQSAHTFFTFDKNNSNIQDISDRLPRRVIYNIDAAANPDLDPSLIGFVTDSSTFQFHLEVDIPMYSKVWDFELKDTFDYQLNQLENIRAATFKVIAENQAPLETYMQLYLMDQDGIIRDSILNGAQRIISAAPVDGQGNPLSTAVTESWIELDKDKIRSLEANGRIYLKANLSTENRGAQSARISTEHLVDIRVGLILETE